MPAENANIARHLGLMAAQQPARPALKVPRGRTRTGEIVYLALTFAELDAEVAAWQSRLTSAGIRPGDRTLVMVRQGLPLIASAFALFRLGAVPVVIDPGIGLKTFLACVTHARPRALVGIPLAQIVSRLFRPSFASVRIRVTASSSLTARLTSRNPELPTPNSAVAPSGATDLAAILFTSGSTGAPKGVCYEHGMFDAQVRLIRETYGIAPGEIDLPMLPIFALFNPALGMTTVVPEIDPRRPAAFDPAKIVQAIRQENVTNSFGSPTLWHKIGAHCRGHGLTLPSLRRVLCAGAPVPAALWRSSRLFLPHGQLHSPYGATEALPVATVSSAEILSPPPAECNPIGYTPPSGTGACVGRPVAGIDVKIIAIADGPIATLADARELPPGEIGEIIVRGPVVTKTYDALPAATALAKIQTPNSKTPNPAGAPNAPDSFGVCDLAFDPSAPRGAVWHRMGDCGYLDADGRLWFCGRKAERVETSGGTLFTEPCEQIFRAHPRAARCALIGVGPPEERRPALVVEATLRNSTQRRHLARDLCQLAITQPATASIRTYFFHPHFPVDVRHNAKIHRLALARWAATAKGFRVDPKR
jgi:acyl-CoA synthetase (AMP-forming)/AMP-acid ligase II